MQLMKTSTKPAAMTPDELRKLLAAAGLNQARAAARIGMNRSTVCRWLKGATPIPRAAAFYLRAVLSIPN